jgi:hypothetical protein
MQNYHILIVKYIPWGEKTPDTVKISSEHFDQSITIPYTYDFRDAVEEAEDWLIKNGHPIVGTGKGKKHSYIIVSEINGSFKRLK